MTKIGIFFRQTAIFTLLSHSWFLFIPSFFLKKMGYQRKAEERACLLAKKYASMMVKLGGGNVLVEGLDNIPNDRNICIVSNHEALADILTLLAIIPFPIGFIAKKELLKIPFLNIWMKQIGCFFIDRKSLRSGMDAILGGVRSIKNEHPMVIFPEGTRSRGKGIKDFKQGSLKLATKAEAVILPISLVGTYKFFEELGHVQGCKIKVRIHQPIETKSLDSEQLKTLASEVGAIIKKGYEALLPIEESIAD
ncbi:lysophospholipid acyltransferase family protein [Spirochaeta cellobiosiphila]|uniref:lysophospholipid acyltransferase family protein n=1 Tax=Spirochaeta cellobiosiphila TaxID=504483 RepID=UPI000418F02D|nr:lysophospholipid acyltransferase family protein [Spirochaeta cellobiosiphila]